MSIELRTLFQAQEDIVDAFKAKHPLGVTAEDIHAALEKYNVTFDQTMSILTAFQRRNQIIRVDGLYYLKSLGKVPHSIQQKNLKVICTYPHRHEIKPGQVIHRFGDCEVFLVEALSGKKEYPDNGTIRICDNTGLPASVVDAVRYSCYVEEEIVEINAGIRGNITVPTPGSLPGDIVFPDWFFRLVEAFPPEDRLDLHNYIMEQAQADGDPFAQNMFLTILTKCLDHDQYITNSQKYEKLDIPEVPPT